ncbi:flagellar hook assembly protein FlgD [Spartinivicinus poritis]|uniref:Basal-body rod modification protein FlgD n=1 Tax=Spartinivicinus poritis TaxID=2994640 RepID=A0ABT5UAV1_9GAMM|nr:flagellar hook assembly protein FlgD [Spartinivicinus sp. A2-2]MDE1463505.1 flagellar hook assembly protein FlgD [Spartinivicinus sp. A2-2]
MSTPITNNSNTNATNAVIEKYQLQQPKQNNTNTELGKNQFLELMITQMKHQDPLNPQKNEEFVAQLAQFSSVEGITNLNQTVESMASAFNSSQALQASALVGRKVLVPTSYTELEAGGKVVGMVDIPQPINNLFVEIYSSSSNQPIKQMNLGKQPAGELDISWDGKDNNNQTQPAGKYQFKAYTLIDGKQVPLNTLLGANVNSVTLGGLNNVLLNVEGVQGEVRLNEVKRIQ